MRAHAHTLWQILSSSLPLSVFPRASSAKQNDEYQTANSSTSMKPPTWACSCSLLQNAARLLIPQQMLQFAAFTFFLAIFDEYIKHRHTPVSKRSCMNMSFPSEMPPDLGVRTRLRDIPKKSKNMQSHMCEMADTCDE